MLDATDWKTTSTLKAMRGSNVRTEEPKNVRIGTIYDTTPSITTRPHVTKRTGNLITKARSRIKKQPLY